MTTENTGSSRLSEPLEPMVQDAEGNVISGESDRDKAITAAWRTFGKTGKTARLKKLGIWPDDNVV